MNQLTLLSEPRARRRDPETSQAAAKSISHGALERKILEAFHYYPNLSDDELCQVLRTSYWPTVKTRRSALSKRGLLVDSGERRPSVRQRDQIVWTLA